MRRHESALHCWLLAALLSVAAAYTTSELCTACRDMSKAFNEGLSASRRSNFGGGNTAWEESRLGVWSFSETRLVGIMDVVCKQATKPAICSSLVEEHEEAIEEWWQKQYRTDPKSADLFQYLCVQRMKVCCPVMNYGKDCISCPGLTLKPAEGGKMKQVACNGHGICEGEGDRSGSGVCKCDTGYEGDTCNQCAEDYYKANSTKDSIGVSCEACHEACEGGCSGPGTEHCSTGCKEGWTWREGGGCADIDECANTTQPACKAEGEFCRNSPGSFSCESCEAACASCAGPGIENCTSCAEGYRFAAPPAPGAPGRCEDVNECLEGGCPVGKVCANSPGSFTCSCPEGQEENEEGHCVAKAATEAATEQSGPTEEDETPKKALHEEL